MVHPSSGSKYKEIVGNGTAMQRIFQLIEQVAYVNTTVLIQGETGTGKELIAGAIHHHSPRKDKPMIKVNCASLPRELIESELFGHEKGSFTGAHTRRIGKFELADQGTIFLDEIGELSLESQVKLLRVIQERQIERVGGRTTIDLDVRIVAATNKELEKEVRKGLFRSDLFYRLNVFPITVPPLRERKEDLPQLIQYYLDRFCGNMGKKIGSISPKAMKALIAHDWPGNVRELEHMLERSVLLTSGGILKEVLLPTGGRLADALSGEAPVRPLEDIEREYILFALNKCNGKVFGKGGAAEQLKINVSTLNSRMRKLGIKREKYYETTGR